MIIETEKTFVKDSLKLSKQVQEDLKELINKLSEERNLESFDIKKMKSFKSAYRIRMGNYRIGIVLEGSKIVLVRVAKRDEIYKIFP